MFLHLSLRDSTLNLEGADEPSTLKHALECLGFTLGYLHQMTSQGKIWKANKPHVALSLLGFRV
jgi:hypothetical protein